MTLPVARQEVHEDQHWVTLSPYAPLDVLGPLARALADAGMLEEFAILGRNRRANAVFPRGLLAADTILRSGIDWPAVLGTRLSAHDANQLAADLTEAAWEPAQCPVVADGFKCNSYAIPEVGSCAEHEAALADPWMDAAS